MAVNLCAALKKTVSRAAHEVLLACFLQSCSTQRWISCSKQNIAYVLYTKVNCHVTHQFGLSYSTKIEHTHVITCECQLRHELYCNLLVNKVRSSCIILMRLRIKWNDMHTACVFLSGKLSNAVHMCVN